MWSVWRQTRNSVYKRFAGGSPQGGRNKTCTNPTRERERGKITKIEERERIYTRPLQRMGGMDEDGQGSRSRLFNFFMEVKPPLCAVLVKRNTFWHKEHFEKELEILFACCESTVLS